MKIETRAYAVKSNFINQYIFLNFVLIRWGQILLQSNHQFLPIKLISHSYKIISKQWLKDPGCFLCFHHYPHCSAVSKRRKGRFVHSVVNYLAQRWPTSHLLMSIFPKVVTSLVTKLALPNYKRAYTWKNTWIFRWLSVLHHRMLLL